MNPNCFKWFRRIITLVLIGLLAYCHAHSTIAIFGYGAHSLTLVAIMIAFYWFTFCRHEGWIIMRSRKRRFCFAIAWYFSLVLPIVGYFFSKDLQLLPPNGINKLEALCAAAGIIFIELLLTIFYGDPEEKD